MNPFPYLRRVVVVALSGLLVACGGGGGESTVTLSSANAETVAAQSIGTMDMLEGMAEMFDGFDDVIETQSALEVLCTSGNFTQNINDVAPLNEVSTGDSIQFYFNACTLQEESSLTLNGGIGVTIDEVSGTEGGAFTRRITFSYNALTMSFDGATVTLNGGFTVEGSSTDGTDLRAVISGEFFSAFVRAGGRSESVRLEDFSLDRSIDAAGDYSIDYDASIASSMNGGTVVFETVTPFTGNGDNPPSAGQLVITGDGGGRIVVNAIDSVNVQILVYADDGDDVVDATINTTWQFLDEQA